MIATFLAFLKTYAVELGALAAILTIVEMVFAPFRTFAARFRKPPSVLIANPKDLLSPPAPGPSKLTLAEFTAMQRLMRDEARADLSKAHGEERQRLEDKIDTLNQRLANPDEALAQQQAIIIDLQAQLARRANDIGGDALTAANSALAAGDFTAARTLFEILAARTQPEVEANAAAAVALGQIAEAEVNWHAAANHYARAANLTPSFDTLRKASDFAERAGERHNALQWSAHLVTWTTSNGTQEQLAMALNEHAINLMAVDRFAEAEALLRRVMNFESKTHGERHADFAMLLGNLALAIHEQGRSAHALNLSTRALAVDRDTIGDRHADYGMHLNNNALILNSLKRYSEAETNYRASLEIADLTVGVAHPTYANRTHNLASCLYKQNRPSEAEALYAEALPVLRATLTATHPDTQSLPRDYLPHTPTSPQIPTLQSLLQNPPISNPPAISAP